MEICYIGHAFHAKTQSTAFILEILRSLGNVKEVTSSPDRPDDDNDLYRLLLTSSYDLYVFLQTEYIAAKIGSLLPGRVVLIPMYDGAYSRSEQFWRSLSFTKAICFSRALHERFQHLNLKTAYFQYMPEVADGEPHLQDGGTYGRSGFFWNRRPDTALNVGLILQLCRRLELRTLHVHDVHDFPVQEDREELLAAYPDIAVTTSTWFANRDELQATASKATYFFAPRLREGIGMTFLEAYARGQIVVAANQPTMDEYLRHGIDGLVYDVGDVDAVKPLSDVAARSIRRAAIRKARHLREDWLEDVERFTSVLKCDERRWNGLSTSALFGNQLRRSVVKRAARLQR